MSVREKQRRVGGPVSSPSQSEHHLGNYYTTMLDPLTAIGLAGNIVQLVDFCTKVVSKANRIYRSADGSLAENFDAETVSRDLLYLTARIEAGSRPSLASDEEHALEDLCTGCNDVAQELLAVLGSLRSGNKLGRWKSFKQALKNVWSKDRIEVLQTRLAGFREELDLHVLIDLRCVWFWPILRVIKARRKSDDYPN